MTTLARILENRIKPRMISLSLTRAHLALGLILGAALVQGLIFVFLIPPWQHYDEPAHFEYAWLAANRPGLPEVGDTDPFMRREVFASMKESGFFKGMAFKPNFEPYAQGGWIGIQQLDDPPLYYLLVSLPLRLVSSWDITSQLYVGRLVSLGLYLVTIFAGWGLIREITSPGNPLRWILPGTAALYPALADLMTSINNDVAAVAVFSLFLWGSVRLIRRGFSLVDFAWVVTAAVLAYLTKSTIYFTILLLPVVLTFALLRGKLRRLAWGMVIVGPVVAAGLLTSWGDAAQWYRGSNQSEPTQLESPAAVLGEHVFSLETKAKVNPHWHRPLFHPIPYELAKELAGQTVTLGAWMWASEPVETSTPVLRDGSSSFGQAVALGTEPSFHAYQVQLPEDTWRLWVWLAPELNQSGKNIAIYYDGLVLAEGARPVDQPPAFDDPRGGSGWWGEQPFSNRLRNASAESGGPRLPIWLESASAKAFPIFSGPSFILAYLTDWRGADWHYYLVGANLFRTFWGRFGWGHVPLLGHKPYRILLMFTIVGMIGCSVWFWRKRRSLPWEIVFVLGLAFAGIWGGAVLRGISHFSANWLSLPVARYGFPAWIPTFLILTLGWREVLRLPGRFFQTPGWEKEAIYFGLLIVFNIFALASIYQFYTKLLGFSPLQLLI